jgi:hypothetical protein
MKNMKNIQAQLKQVAAGRAVPTANENAEEGAGSPARGGRQASRAGKVFIGGWLPADFKRSLLMVKAQTGETTEQIVSRLLNDEFRAKNLPVIGE